MDSGPNREQGSRVVLRDWLKTCQVTYELAINIMPQTQCPASIRTFYLFIFLFF
jgi:hypothetical protein